MNDLVDVTVHEYVTAVRAALADLPAEEVEELVSGMEADLADVASESGDLHARLGTPEAYAEELRSAAGLPQRDPAALSGVAAAAVPWPRRVVDRVQGLGAAILARFPWLRDLRPTWWLARGAIAGWLLAHVLHSSAVFLLAAVGAALSFWLGKRQDGLAIGWRRLILAGDWLAVLLLLPAFASMGPRIEYVDMGSGPPPAAEVPDGVVVNGTPATNLYVYGPDGARLDRVRIFNEYGQAVALSGWAFEDAWRTQTAESSAGVGVAQPPTVNREVFPVRWDDRTGWEVSSGHWMPPVQIVPLPGDTPSMPPSVSPSPTPSGSVSMSPSGSRSPSPSASGSASIQR